MNHDAHRHVPSIRIELCGGPADGLVIEVETTAYQVNLPFLWNEEVGYTFPPPLAPSAFRKAIYHRTDKTSASGCVLFNYIETA